MNKPTLNEVKAEFSRKGITDPKIAEQFINYYESNGWMVGRVKMKSWKHAIANWAIKNKPKQQEMVYRPEPGTVAYSQHYGLDSIDNILKKRGY